MIERHGTLSICTVLFGASTLVIVASYTCLIAAFYINDLHHYSYDDIGAQTPNVGNLPFAGAPFPLAGAPNLATFGLLLLVVALFVAVLGPSVLPLAVLGLSGTLLWHWTSLRWSGRLFWISVILTAHPVLIVMRSPLGRSIRTWLLD